MVDLPQGEPARSVVLVGFMGSGKSAVGRLLAERLGWEFVDTDLEIERREGARVERIIRDSGVAHFRRCELGVIREVLEGERAVVAAGGGLFLSRPARVLVRRVATGVWLDLPLERVRERLGADSSRPLWPADRPLEQRLLYEKRRAAYALAEFRVGATGPGSELAERILKRLSMGPRGAGA